MAGDVVDMCSGRVGPILRNIHKHGLGTSGCFLQAEGRGLSVITAGIK